MTDNYIICKRTKLGYSVNYPTKHNQEIHNGSVSPKILSSDFQGWGQSSLMIIEG